MKIPQLMFRFHGECLPKCVGLTPESAMQQAVSMKATFKIPDELCREMKVLVNPVPSGDCRNFKAPLAHLVPEGETDHSMDAMRENIVKHWNEPS